MSQFHEGLTALGTFVLNIPEATPNGRYRSVIVSSIDVSISELVDRCVPAAVNGDDSLSGWLSLNAAATGTGTRWPGPVVFTGSHRASLGALAEGDAVIASIDPWSLAFIEAEEPDLVRGLHQIGQGPSTPTPIVACRADVPATRRESLLAALIETVDSPKMDDVKDALHIDGFAPVDLDDYRALSALAPA